MEVIGIKVFSNWGSEDTWSSVISEVEEDLRVFSRLKDLASSGLVSSEDLKNVLSGDSRAFIINFASIVDIDTRGTGGGWLVEELVWEWVLR